MPSTLTPAIMASVESKSALCDCICGICCEQTPEKAAAKNARTTFLPRWSLSLNVVFPVPRRVKSGAGSPTFRVLVWSGTVCSFQAPGRLGPLRGWRPGDPQLRCYRFQRLDDESDVLVQVHAELLRALRDVLA